jgi:DNA-binding winged helix-turn-helix (wHTH) protein
MAAAAQIALNRRHSFGHFVLDTGARHVLRDGRRVPLTPKEFEALLLLIGNSGRAMSKADLIRGVWPGTFVADGSLARNISVLRRRLGSDSIETVPKYGYRFAWPVCALPATGPHEESASFTHQKRQSNQPRFWGARLGRLLISLPSCV